MNGFTKKNIETLTLGEKLKKLRGERRMSLGDVSRNTKIQVKYLEFIEEGAYDKLPADVYVKGFLKNYAEFLGVSENALNKLFEKEKEIKKNLNLRSSRKEKNGNRFKILQPLKIDSFTFTPKIIAGSLIALLVLAGFVYLYKEVGSFASVPRLVVLSPLQNTSVSGNSVLVEGVTDRDAKLFLNGQPTLVNDEGRFRESLILQSGANVISVKAINRFQKEIEEIITVQTDYEEPINLTEANKASDSGALDSDAEAGNISMEIKADPGPVTVSVKTDGNLIFSGTMLSGSVQKFEAKEKISIDSDKASNTFIKFNGKDLGALGEKATVIKEVIFTKDTK
jgi:cytoskeletal protein RodZ